MTPWGTGFRTKIIAANARRRMRVVKTLEFNAPE